LSYNPKCRTRLCCHTHAHTQGQTAYPYLIAQLPLGGADISVPLGGGDSAARVAHFGNDNFAEDTLQGPPEVIIPHALSTVIKKNVVKGSKVFADLHPTQQVGVQATYKADDGILFFLGNSFFYVKKPVFHFYHDEVISVAFKRAESSFASSSFDLVFKLKNKTTPQLDFSTVPNTAFDAIFKFLEGKNIRIENANAMRQRLGKLGLEAAEDPTAAGRKRAAEGGAGSLLAQLTAAAEGSESEEDASSFEVP